MFKKLIILASVAAFAFNGYAAEKAAEVTEAKGKVEIVHGDAVMGKKAEKGSELVFEDILRTKRRGYAEVGFIDGTNVKVFEKSRLTINGIERTTDGYNAEIQKGKVLFSVEKMHDVAGDFRVKTTNSVIGVKGTTFAIVTGGLVTVVEVYNGKVEFLGLVSAADVASGKVDPTKMQGAGKGGDAGANSQQLLATLTSGQGAVLSGEGVQVYELGEDGGGSLIFGEVSTGDREPAQGEGEGTNGGSTDEELFGSIGTGEEGGEGEGVDMNEELSSAEFDLGNIEAAQELAQSLGYEGTEEEFSDMVQEAVGDALDFYTDPNATPDLEEQIDQARGSVNIIIDFN
jgi:hypothetical protein